MLCTWESKPCSSNKNGIFHVIIKIVFPVLISELICKMADLHNYSSFLQQVLLNLGTLDVPLLVEMDINVLPKPTGVVIPHRLGIAKG